MVLFGNGSDPVVSRRDSRVSIRWLLGCRLAPPLGHRPADVFKEPVITLTGKRKADVTEILANELAQHGGRCFFCRKQLHTPVWHHRKDEVKEAIISGLAQTGDLTGLRQGTVPVQPRRYELS